MVPQNVKDKVAAVKQDIIDGKNVIFAGPLKDQNGKVIVPAGKSMTDPEMLGMMWFVDGVIGNTK
jgi:basic membrane protein A